MAVSFQFVRPIWLPDLRRSDDHENETRQAINSIDSTMDWHLICIHISDRTYLSPVIEQAIKPENWNTEQSLKTDMKYIEKFWNHICNIVLDVWWIIVKNPYHSIIFQTLNTLVIFLFIKVLVANVQSLFQNCIRDYQLLSKRYHLQCLLSLIIKHGDMSIAPFCHF